MATALLIPELLFLLCKRLQTYPKSNPFIRLSVGPWTLDVGNGLSSSIFTPSIPSLAPEYPLGYVLRCLPVALSGS